MRRPLLERQPDGSYRAVERCFSCGRAFVSEKTVTRDQLDRIERGDHVQDVLPDWAPGERELFFISGMCNDCWNGMLGCEEDCERDDDGHSE